MARKRVSLKDKGPETLGLNEKKGKGIDVLLGGPIASQTRLASSSTVTKSKATNTEGINMAAENQNNMTNVPTCDMILIQVYFNACGYCALENIFELIRTIYIIYITY